MKLARHEIRQDILARRVKSPSDLAPGQALTATTAAYSSPSSWSPSLTSSSPPSSLMFQQGVLAEEQHEPGPVLVHGAALPLDDARALHNVDELDLLVRRELRERYALQLLADGRRYGLREHVVVLLVFICIVVVVVECAVE